MRKYDTMSDEVVAQRAIDAGRMLPADQLEEVLKEAKATEAQLQNLLAQLEQQHLDTEVRRRHPDSVAMGPVSGADSPDEIWKRVEKVRQLLKKGSK